MLGPFDCKVELKHGNGDLIGFLSQTKGAEMPYLQVRVTHWLFDG